MVVSFLSMSMQTNLSQTREELHARSAQLNSGK